MKMTLTPIAGNSRFWNDYVYREVMQNMPLFTFKHIGKPGCWCEDCAFDRYDDRQSEPEEDYGSFEYY